MPNLLSLNDGCGKSAVTGNEWIGASLLPFYCLQYFVLGKPMHIQTERLDANHDLKFHSLHYIFTLKFKIHQLHVVRLY